jgi:hypothetical protein
MKSLFCDQWHLGEPGHQEYYFSLYPEVEAGMQTLVRKIFMTALASTTSLP